MPEKNKRTYESQAHLLTLRLQDDEGSPELTYRAHTPPLRGGEALPSQNTVVTRQLVLRLIEWLKEK